MTNIIRTSKQSDISNNSTTTSASNNAANTTLPTNNTNSTTSTSASNQANTISASNHHQSGGGLGGGGGLAASGSGGGGGGGGGGGNQETCLICGDVASGKHYGLRSCEACKAFFKRTVQGKIEYSCPATRECEINKRRRKACQACRFQKCLNMGMLKEGVRLDRVRGGRQKYRRGTSPSPGLSSASASCLSASSLNNTNNNNSSSTGAMSNNNNGINNNNNNNNNNNSSNMIGNQANSSSSLSSSASLAAMAAGSGHHNHLAFPLGNAATIGATHQQTLIGTGETNKIMTALINCEPEELSASPGQYVSNIPTNLNVQLKTLYILGDLFDRELVSLIGWAKQIPGFSETITLNDQMRLLQSTWAEVIALSIGYRSHLKRIENYKQQQQQQQLGGICVGGGTNSALGVNHFMSTTTPSPTSSSPASTTSSSYNNNNNGAGNSRNSLYNLESIEIRLVFAKDLIMDFKHAILCGAEEIFYNCVQLIKRLDHLRITPKEFILLKAISLTNADVRLENPKATFRLRDLVMDALYEVTLMESFNGSGGGGLISQHDISSLANMKQEISSNNNGGAGGSSGGSSSSASQLQHLKVEAQERPLSSMNQYASSSSSPTPPSRSSSSVPSSSSTSSISPHNSSSGSHNNSSNIINAATAASAAVAAAAATASSSLGGSKSTIVNNRMNQVLLCLPVLRQIDTSIRKFWNDIRKGPNNVPMNKLFEEMLEPCQRMYRSSVEM